MRRVHRLALLLLAIVWSQIPGSAAPPRATRAWAPFIRGAAGYQLPVAFLWRVSRDATIVFGDPGEALARYSDRTVTLDRTFRDPRTGGLLPIERLWESPGKVGAVYHELFHAFFEMEVSKDPEELARFQRRAEVVFRDVPLEKRAEVAEEAVGCWVSSLIETAVAVVRRQSEAKTRGWPPVAEWDPQDLRALANGYQVHFQPGACCFGYYQDGGRVMHTEARMDAWFVEFAWRRVLGAELPQRFDEFLSRCP